jgi:hypothetical protein
VHSAHSHLAASRHLDSHITRVWFISTPDDVFVKFIIYRLSSRACRIAMIALSPTVKRGHKTRKRTSPPDVANWCFLDNYVNIGVLIVDKSQLSTHPRRWPVPPARRNEAIHAKNRRATIRSTEQS